MYHATEAFYGNEKVKGMNKLRMNLTSQVLLQNWFPLVDALRTQEYVTPSPLW